MPAPASGNPPRPRPTRSPSRRRSSPLPPAQVTVIGHNTQTVAAVGLFVGAGIPVRVYSVNSSLEESLAPYPGVTVTVVEDYTAAPADLPPPPYVVTVDTPEEAAPISAWLPPTWARFLERTEHRHSRAIPGFRHFEGTQPEDRAVVLRRLASLARLDALCAVARDAKEPLILLYGDPDPDGIGAGLGLAALWRAAGISAPVRFSGEVQRYQNKLLLQYLKGRGIARLERQELEEADAIAIVDAQPGFWRESPPKAAVVIDHHPRREDTDAPFVDLREDYGATASIITGYLLDAEVPIDRRLATALLYGITTDTNDLKRHTGPADIAAFEALHQKADRRFLSRLEKSQIPAPVLDHIAWGINHRVVHRDLVVVHFGSVPSPDVLVQVADLLLLTCGISWVVCAGVVERGGKRLVAVFRGDGHQQDVGARAKVAFARLGSAGGHRTMGRAEIPLGEGIGVLETVDLLIDHLFTRMSEARRRRMAKVLRGHLADERPADPDDYELGA